MNGNLEEVLDTCVISLNDQKHIVAATTSPIIQIRRLDSGHSILLEGHTAAVLSVDSRKKWEKFTFRIVDIFRGINFFKNQKQKTVKFLKQKKIFHKK